MPSRRIFVGDPQGCREELERLLEELRFDPAADELHPVGDFVNRGPDSAGVLRLCRELGAGGVLGNHDVHVLRQARDPALRGDRSVLEELAADPEGDALLAWLAARPLVRGWDDVVLVHAGVDPRWRDPVEVLTGVDPIPRGPEVECAVRVRFCTASGAVPESDWPEPGPPFRPWYAFWSERPDERRTAVFGHWARRGLVVEERVRGLDTGCVYGGRLTAWIAEEDRVVSVPAARTWCPAG